MTTSFVARAKGSDKGLTLETSALKLLRWPIYVINPLDNTKLPCYTLPPMQHHSFLKNLSSLSKITRATSLKIGASYAKNWAGDLLVRIYPQLRINKSDIPNTVSYYYKKLLNIDNSKCIIRHYTKKKRSQLHNLTQFETSKNLIT